MTVMAIVVMVMVVAVTMLIVKSVAFIVIFLCDAFI